MSGVEHRREAGELRAVDRDVVGHHEPAVAQPERGEARVLEHSRRLVADAQPEARAGRRRQGEDADEHQADHERAHARRTVGNAPVGAPCGYGARVDRSERESGCGS